MYFLVVATSQFIPELRIGYLYTYWGPLVRDQKQLLNCIKLIIVKKKKKKTNKIIFLDWTYFDINFIIAILFDAIRVTIWSINQFN